MLCLLAQSCLLPGHLALGGQPPAPFVVYTYVVVVGWGTLPLLWGCYDTTVHFVLHLDRLY